MSAAEFKARCLEFLDHVTERRQRVVVTKRGKSVARVVPVVDKPKRLVGAMGEQIESLTLS